MSLPYITSGSYLGDGTDDRTILVGFQPDLVILKGNTTTYPVFRTSAHSGDKTSYYQNASANAADLVQSLITTGFQVGVGMNANGITYYWTALADNGSGNIKVGTYTGNGVDNRSITGVGFTPGYVMVKNDGVNLSCFRDSLETGDATHLLSSNSNQPNMIQALEVDGFQVGTDARVNTNAQVYYYYAFNIGSFFAVGTYTGTGADNTDITGVGFMPLYVQIKRDGPTLSFYKDGGMSGDLTSQFTNVVLLADTIQSFIPDGFQIGSNGNVNNVGTVFHYLAIKGNVPDVVSSSKGIGLINKLNMLNMRQLG